LLCSDAVPSCRCLSTSAAEFEERSKKAIGIKMSNQKTREGDALTNSVRSKFGRARSLPIGFARAKLCKPVKSTSEYGAD
jgi:hypothetical protein